MKVLLDTNVYLAGARSDDSRTRFGKTFLPLRPATFLAAVVAYELAVDAVNRSTRRLVHDLVRPLVRAGRVVTPTFEDWLDAAELMTTLHTKEKGWRSKLPALLNDVLIALSARRIGAELLTYDEADFRLIHKHLDFSFRVLAM